VQFPIRREYVDTETPSGLGRIDTGCRGDSHLFRFQKIWEIG
jgi:hypothetical protein